MQFCAIGINKKIELNNYLDHHFVRTQIQKTLGTMINESQNMSNNIFTRSYYPEELKILDTRLSKEKEALRKIIKYENFLIALLIGISSAFFTTIIKHDSFLFACLPTLARASRS